MRQRVSSPAAKPRLNFVKRLLTQLVISFEITSNTKIPLEAQMSDAPSYSEAADGLHSEKSAPVEPAEESKRLQSSVAQFTSKSIKELEGLTFELHGLEEFLKSETERVQGDINNALAGLRVIIDTISPWRNVRPDPVQGKPSSTPEPRMQRSTLASGQR
jgi:hypothetical protein